MDLNLAGWRTNGGKALIDFLNADLDLGFTFAQLSQLEQGLDEPASKRAMCNAERVIETVRRFSDLIVEGEQVHAIESRLAKLELFVSQIQSNPSTNIDRLTITKYASIESEFRAGDTRPTWVNDIAGVPRKTWECSTFLGMVCVRQFGQ